MKNLITLEQACKMTPYTADYLGQLIRKRKLRAWKEKGRWLTTREAVEEYMLKVAEESFEHQRKLTDKIPAARVKYALFNLKGALALIGLIAIAAGILGSYIYLGSEKSGVCNLYEIEKDSQGNEVIRINGKEYVRNILAAAKENFSKMEF